MGLMAAAFVLAFVLETTLEYLFGLWWKPWGSDKQRKGIISLVGLILGISLAIMGNLDILALVGVNIPIAGVVLTGAMIGRGSDIVHQFAVKFLPGGISPK